MPDYRKLLFCEFQNYEGLIMSVVGGEPKKKNANTSCIATKHIERAFLMGVGWWGMLKFRFDRRISFSEAH